MSPAQRLLLANYLPRVLLRLRSPGAAELLGDIVALMSLTTAPAQD